jgi:heterodisulfide reductase subunit B
MSASFGYFPGCSLSGTGKEFDLSLREVLRKLDVELKEIDDWCCCGASSAHVSSHLLSIALPALNIQLAGQQGLKEIMAPCAACYNRLIGAGHELRTNEHARMKIESVLGGPVNTGMRIMNVIELFDEIGADAIKAQTKMDLSGLRIACYYGCLLVRPADLVKFDDAERPASMERIVAATGAATVDWNFKTDCCGASHSIAHMNVVCDLTKKILDDAVAHGADAVVVACPMCHSNLDMRQRNIRKTHKDHRDIPILYLTELIGYAFGISPNSLGLNIHFVDPSDVLAKTKKKEAVA